MTNTIENTSLQLVVLNDNGEAMADSLTVAELFGKDHAKVLRAIESLDCSVEFREANFGLSTYRPNNARRDYPLYEMTKDGFTFLAMGFTGEKAAEWKEKYISAFNMLERRSHQPDLSNPAQLRTLLLENVEKVIELQSDLDAAKPKVAALDRIAVADGSLCVTDAAKALQMGPKALFGLLSQNGWIYKRAGNAHWLGYQAKVATGLPSKCVSRRKVCLSWLY